MDPKKQRAIIFMTILGAFLVYALIRIVTEDDEARIRKVVNAAVLAVEKCDAQKGDLLISDTYSDKYGNDKAALIRLIVNIFKDLREVNVDLKRLKIEVKPEEGKGEADIAFGLYFKKRADEQLYGDKAKLKVYFQKEGKLWKVHEVEYIGADELLFIQTIA